MIAIGDEPARPGDHDARAGVHGECHLAVGVQVVDDADERGRNYPKRAAVVSAASPLENALLARRPRATQVPSWL